MKIFYLSLVATVLFVSAGRAQAVIVSGADASTTSGNPYATLGAAFTSINASSQAGNTITITVTGVITEPGSAVLNQSSGPWTSLTIIPLGETQITGNIAGPLIYLNGADNVNVNGLNFSGNSLLIRNTSAAAPAMQLLNDAVNNIVTNCTFESGNTNLTGAISFLTTTGTLGNSNNSISYCNFRDRTDIAATPRALIQSVGSSSAKNANNTIDHCNFYNFYQNGLSAYGIYIGAGSTDWTISNNSFYQTASRTSTTNATSLYGIYTSGTDADNMQINGNYFGGSAPLCAGGPLTLTTVTMGVDNSIFPIYMSTGIVTASTIQNNVIQNISSTSMASAVSATTGFAGILAVKGSYNVSGNTVGSGTGTGSVVVNYSGDMNGFNTYHVDGITAGSAGGILNVTNNTIGSITMGGTNIIAIMYFRGIYIGDTPASPVTVSGNIIGSLVTANSIQNITTNRPATIIGATNTTSSLATINIINNTISNITNFSTNTSTKNSVMGINPNFANPFNVSGNTIREISSASETIGTVPGINVITGILQNGTSTSNLVSGNIISGLHATSASARVSVYGIAVLTVTGVTGSITKNTIYDLTAISSNTGSRIYGTNKYGGYSWTFANNMISLTNAPYTNALDIQGMHEDILLSPFTNYYYYNSVYIGGSAAASAVNTYAFNRTSTTPVIIKDNIFCNLRTGGTGYHVAIANTNASAAGWGILNDFNDLYNTVPANLTQWLGSGAGNNLSMAGWRAAQPGGSGGDANSLNLFPAFADTTIADLHLDPNHNCRLDGYGTPIGVTTDYDNDTRHALRPDMGADEFTFVQGNILAGVSSTAVCENKTVSVAGTTYISSTCELIARVMPSGGSPVAGNINACVTRDAVQQYFNGEPYVQRHYDIEPVTNAATATATITLYFTDQEFSSYNTVNSSSWPMLPTSALGNTDPARHNVRLTQFHGIPTAGLPTTSPANYAGTRVLINPGAANVVWNGFYWAVTIPVNGFSGFYLHSTIYNTPLPVSVNYITGRRQRSNHLLNWKVTCNSSPTATMVLQRSNDSRNFVDEIYSITADAVRCNQPFDYTDAAPLKGMNYYRLKITDANGKITYSTTVALLNAVKGFDIISIAPNPVVNDNFKLHVASAQAGNMQLQIFDMQGRLVNRQTVALAAGFNSLPVYAGKLSAGSYTIKAVMNDEQARIIRFVKQR